MTEFRIESVKEVIVNDLHQDTSDNFLYSCFCFGITSAIWVDGMIIQLITPTSKISEKYNLVGKRLYEQIIFVKYSEYTKTVKWNGGNFELALRNYSNFPRFRELAKWIKSQLVWKEILEESKMKSIVGVSQ